MCHCVQLSYTTQHRTVLTIFPLILQTITVAQMMSTAGEGEQVHLKTRSVCAFIKQKDSELLVYCLLATIQALLTCPPEPRHLSTVYTNPSANRCGSTCSGRVGLYSELTPGRWSTKQSRHIKISQKCQTQSHPPQVADFLDLPWQRTPYMLLQCHFLLYGPMQCFLSHRCWLQTSSQSINCDE